PAPCRAPCGCGGRGATAGPPPSPAGSAGSPRPRPARAGPRRAPRAARSPPGPARPARCHHAAWLCPRRRILTRRMIIAKRLKGKAIATWLGPTGDAARRALTRARQRITSAPSRLDFYFDIVDPMSYLTAQAVARLIEAYPVELAVHIVTPPASDVDPAPDLRARHAVRDAQLVAQYWNVEFPAHKEADSGMVREVGMALIRERPADEQLRAVAELCGAMWSGDRKKLGTLLLRYGTESSVKVAPILNANYGELR